MYRVEVKLRVGSENSRAKVHAYVHATRGTGLVQTLTYREPPPAALAHGGLRPPDGVPPNAPHAAKRQHVGGHAHELLPELEVELSAHSTPTAPYTTRALVIDAVSAANL